MNRCEKAPQKSKARVRQRDAFLAQKRGEKQEGVIYTQFIYSLYPSLCLGLQRGDGAEVACSFVLTFFFENLLHILPIM